MTRNASLPTYVLPALLPANDAFWRALAALLREAGLQDVPHVLSPSLELGRIPPTTLFTQVCGYPLRTLYPGQYTLLGIPHYGAPGCDGRFHRAFVIVREEDPASSFADLRGRRFAINGPHSNTGMNLPRHLAAPLAQSGRFFSRVTETGSHAASLAAVESGESDAAAIDCVTYAFHGDHAPETLRGLRVLCATACSPAIPFVTSSATNQADTTVLRAALARLGGDPAYAAIRAGLRLRAISAPGEEDYGTLLRYQDEAARQGYKHLA